MKQTNKSEVCEQMFIKMWLCDCASWTRQSGAGASCPETGPADHVPGLQDEPFAGTMPVLKESRPHFTEEIRPLCSLLRHVPMLWPSEPWIWNVLTDWCLCSLLILSEPLNVWWTCCFSYLMSNKDATVNSDLFWILGEAWWLNKSIGV